MSELRVAVVTGGASGIGAACVATFIKRGWRVAFSFLGESERQTAETLLSGFESSGGSAVALDCDVRNDEACRFLARATVERFGRIDALVCCAGTTRIVPQSDLESLTIDDFTTTMAVNTAGVFQTVRACAPALIADEGGAVVIISSYGAIYGTGSSIAYAASKGATNTLTMSLARELAPTVRVNAVCPALVTGGFAQRLDPDLFRQRVDQQLSRAPLRKVAHPSDVASDVYWLAAETRLITGSVILLDCGLHLTAG
jgi:3-oxoacyl-[acyl-carrier protein] reductase